MNIKNQKKLIHLYTLILEMNGRLGFILLLAKKDRALIGLWELLPHSLTDMPLLPLERFKLPFLPKILSLAQLHAMAVVVAILKMRGIISRIKVLYLKHVSLTSLTYIKLNRHVLATASMDRPSKNTNAHLTLLFIQPLLLKLSQKSITTDQWNPPWWFTTTSLTTRVESINMCLEVLRAAMRLRSWATGLTKKLAWSIGFAQTLGALSGEKTATSEFSMANAKSKNKPSLAHLI